MQLVEIGLMKDNIFYPIGESQVLMPAIDCALKVAIDGKLATELMKLDTSKGLPLLDPSTLYPAPPAVSAPNSITRCLP
jgi:hypothetical protein